MSQVFSNAEADRAAFAADHSEAVEGHLWVVAVYDSWRTYGGPEEGGWWYTEGELESLAGGFTSEDEAYELATDLRSDLELTRARDSYAVIVVELGRRDVIPAMRDQLCHYDGDLDPDRDYVTRWDVPDSFPEGRPHYC